MTEAEVRSTFDDEVVPHRLAFLAIDACDARGMAPTRANVAVVLELAHERAVSRVAELHGVRRGR